MSARNSLIELILQRLRDQSKESLRLVEYKHLFSRHENIGLFLIYDEENGLGQLGLDTFEEIVIEARQAQVVPPFHVYAQYEVFQSSSVIFHKLPWRVGQP